MNNEEMLVMEAIKALKELREDDAPVDNKPTLVKVVYNEPLTTVYWSDGILTEYVDNEEYNPEKGFEYCVLKKMIGERGFAAWRETCERLKKKVHLS